MTSTIFCSRALGSADPFASVGLIGAGKFGSMFLNQILLGL